jgi:hypothetical protein
MTGPVPHVPPDSATYLEGDLPGYQGDDSMDLGDESVKMNDLDNPFDSEPPAPPPTLNPDIPVPPDLLESLSIPAQTSQLIPLGYDGSEFVKPQLLDTPFYMVYNGDTSDVDGLFDPQTFATEPETNIMYSSGNGHLVVLACVKQEGPLLHLVDGGGREYTAEMHDIDSEEEA